MWTEKGSKRRIIGGIIGESKPHSGLDKGQGHCLFGKRGKGGSRIKFESRKKV